MLILLFVISIISMFLWLILGAKRFEKEDEAEAETCLALGCLVIALIVGGVFLFNLAGYINYCHADERIEAVKTKNAEIEKEIQTSVQAFLEHEGKTYEGMTPDDALAYAVAYPELASNELVKEQIATYKSNREQVLTYEQQKIDRKIKAWWLWFGNN